MVSFWNEKQKELRTLIREESSFNEAINLVKELHSIVHTPEVSGEKSTYFELLTTGLTKEIAEVMPTKKDVTIVWNLWHITRIEDITVNLLINNENQILNEEWLKRLNTTVTDTGNAMTDDEIIELSKSIDLVELLQYRTAVGKKTRETINNLNVVDLKRKFTSQQVERILIEGGVTNHPDSIWLKDFWGRKDVAGILLLPVTRHQFGHLNDSIRLKKVIEKNR